MFKNYLKIAIRNVLRYKGYSFINIAGLAIGMAVCILILLWVRHELSYDKFHENVEDIYRVIQERSRVTPTPLAPTLKAEIPEVIDAARYRILGSHLLKYKEKNVKSNEFYAVDPSFLDMFSFKFLKGDPATALKEPFSMVLTEKMARRVFGDKDPMGEFLLVDNRLPVKITGVIKDVPQNSHLQFDLLTPFVFIKHLWGADLDDWRWVSHISYVQLQKGSDLQAVHGKINAIIKKYRPDINVKLFLQPISRVHLHSTFDERGKGSISYVYIFSAIAMLILLIACINFMNLTTARGTARAKEVGVRKVIGARRKDLVGQFFGESILSSVLALVLAVVMVELVLPVFNNLTSKQLSLDIFGNTSIMPGLIFIALVTGIVSAAYPSLFLSSFRPVNILKGATAAGPGGRSRLRKILVVSQFALSIFLVICTILIYRQLQYVGNQELGYEKDYILYTSVNSDLLRRLSPAADEIRQNPNILGLTRANTLPCDRETTSSQLEWEGKAPADKMRVEVLKVDYYFLKTFNMQMLEGRFFSREHPTDAAEGFVVNEAAVKAMGYTNQSAVGKRFGRPKQMGKIIGVVKNFHSRSLRYEISPLVIVMTRGDRDTLIFKLRGDGFSAGMNYLEGIWKKYVPDYPFDLRFFDEALDDLYKSDQRMGKVFSYFTFLAIFISCLGLFGLASFTAEQKTKEIGIRKALGATMPAISMMLSREFTRWVLIANIAAWPAAYYAVSRWLQGFAYRTGIALWAFIFSALLALVVALVTVSYQTIKAAAANPVEALRYE